MRNGEATAGCCASKMTAATRVSARVKISGLSIHVIVWVSKSVDVCMLGTCCVQAISKTSPAVLQRVEPTCLARHRQGQADGFLCVETSQRQDHDEAHDEALLCGGGNSPLFCLEWCVGYFVRVGEDTYSSREMFSLSWLPDEPVYRPIMATPRALASW